MQSRCVSISIATSKTSVKSLEPDPILGSAYQLEMISAKDLVKDVKDEIRMISKMILI